MKCNEAARQIWGSHATNMWKNAPDPSNISQHPLGPVLEGDEIPNMPDITLEHDLLGLEEDIDITSTRSQPDAPPDNEIRPEERDRLHVAVKDLEAKESYYIEEFPAELGAGAVWGEDRPFFEKVWHKQQENGLSMWGPFEDKEEWELAKWLVSNVGQKQIDAFLNLKIVRSHRFPKFDSERTLISSPFIDAGTNKAIVS